MSHFVKKLVRCYFLLGLCFYTFQHTESQNLRSPHVQCLGKSSQFESTEIMSCTACSYALNYLQLQPHLLRLSLFASATTVVTRRRRTFALFAFNHSTLVIIQVNVLALGSAIAPVCVPFTPLRAARTFYLRHFHGTCS